MIRPRLRSRQRVSPCTCLFLKLILLYCTPVVPVDFFNDLFDDKNLREVLHSDPAVMYLNWKRAHEVVGMLLYILLSFLLEHSSQHELSGLFRAPQHELK